MRNKRQPAALNEQKAVFIHAVTFVASYSLRSPGTSVSCRITETRQGPLEQRGHETSVEPCDALQTSSPVLISVLWRVIVADPYLY